MACDTPEKLDALKLAYNGLCFRCYSAISVSSFSFGSAVTATVGSGVPGITVLSDGHHVSRKSDFIIYSVEAEFIERVVAQYGPCKSVPNSTSLHSATYRITLMPDISRFEIARFYHQQPKSVPS